MRKEELKKETAKKELVYLALDWAQDPHNEYTGDGSEFAGLDLDSIELYHQGGDVYLVDAPGLRQTVEIEINGGKK